MKLTLFVELGLRWRALSIRERELAPEKDKLAAIRALSALQSETLTVLQRQRLVAKPEIVASELEECSSRMEELLQVQQSKIEVEEIIARGAKLLPRLIKQVAAELELLREGYQFPWKVTRIGAVQAQLEGLRETRRVARELGCVEHPYGSEQDAHAMLYHQWEEASRAHAERAQDERDSRKMANRRRHCCHRHEARAHQRLRLRRKKRFLQ